MCVLVDGCVCVMVLAVDVCVSVMLQTPHRVLNLVIGPVAGVAVVEVFVVVDSQRSNSLFVSVIPPSVLSISNSSCSSVSDWVLMVGCGCCDSMMWCAMM